MSWAEVHDEAERLEHAVSERLIDRIDEMLGRPAVDPHGDPIPTAEGTIARPDYLDLLTAPSATPLVVIARPRSGRQRSCASSNSATSCPAAVRSIEARDAAADSVQLRSASARPTTIGTRAASKVLVTPRQTRG